jgi:hypothetical protein
MGDRRGTYRVWWGNLRDKRKDFDTFAELHNVATRFVMLVCLSVCMEQFSSHWMDFH